MAVIPEWEISIIKSDEVHTLRVGNVCIDRLTEQNVSELMKNFRKKRLNIMVNRKYIDQLTIILEAYERKSPTMQMPEDKAEELSEILDQLCKGLHLTTKQKQLADSCLIPTVRA